jgi:hypothetical protein
MENPLSNTVFKINLYDPKLNKIYMTYNVRGNKTGGSEDIDFDRDDEPVDFAPADETDRDADIIIDGNTNTTDGENINVEMSIFPEDTVYDLERKIFYVTRIPIYRQHLFYVINHENVKKLFTSYKVKIQEKYIPINGFKMFDKKENAFLSGIPIDKSFEENKNDICIEAADIFTKIEVYKNTFIKEVYVIDLKPLLLSLKPSILSDQYQFNLIYFGMVLKYFPKLSQGAFKTLFVNEEMMQSEYPMLAENYSSIKRQILFEQEICKLTYAKSYSLKHDISKLSNSLLSITSSFISVEPIHKNIVVNLRNLIDLIPATKNIPIIMSSFKSKNVEIRNYVKVTKRHLHSYKQKYRNIIDGGIKNKTTLFVLNYGNRTHQMHVSSFGEYTIQSEWKDIENVTPKMIISTLNKMVEPITEQINSHGSTILMSGGYLEPPKINSTKTKISALNVSLYFPYEFTTSNFHEIRTRLKKYETANILEIRPVQIPNSFVVFFKKGITNYNSFLFEKLYSYLEQQKNLNQYSFLTNIIFNRQWNKMFSGKKIQFTHRSTDIKIDVFRVNKEELNIIFYYLFVFLFDLVSGKNKIELFDSKIKTGDKRLKRLYERDPNLFILKKFDEKATNYCLLCQGKKQPNIYNEKEYKSLPENIRKRATKYWNFTRKTPVYYTCTDKKYKYLGFQVGKHPLNYCLPCCGIKKPAAGSKAEQIDKYCMEHHEIDAEKLTELFENKDKAYQKVRYIFTYGKELPKGRISYIPYVLENELFDTNIGQYVYRLIGVQQHVNNINDGGFIHSISTILNLTMDKFIQEIISKLKSGENNSYLWKDHFESVDEISDALRETFVLQNDLNYSKFSEGASANKNWKTTILNLIRYTYDLEIIKFEDDGNENFNIFMQSDVKVSMTSASGNYGFIISNETGTYPMFLIDQKLFLIEPNNIYASRRQFFMIQNQNSIIQDNNILRIFNIVKINDTLSDRKETVMNLSFVKTIMSVYLKEYKIVLKLANKNRKCYAVILQNTQNEKIIYVPIKESNFLESEKITYDPISSFDKFPADELFKFIDLVNKVIDDNNKLGSEMPIKKIIPHKLIQHNEKIMGFVTHHNIHYYHNQITQTKSKDHFKLTDADIIDYPYDICEINNLIFSEEKKTKYSPELLKIISVHVYKNYSYKLFLLEFMTYIKTAKNDHIRDSIYALISQINANNFYKKRDEILGIISNYPQDVKIINSILSPFMDNFEKKENIISEILQIVKLLWFEFDNILMEKISDMDQPSMMKKLDTIMKNLVVLIDSYDNPTEMPNIYSACAYSEINNLPYCKDKKLIIEKDKYQKFLQVLSNDLNNPLKKKYLTLLSLNVIDEFNFIQLRDNIITVNI